MGRAAAAEEPPKVTIDAERRICIDGKPFFPIGIYNVPPDRLEQAKELGFNTVHTYAGEGSVQRKDSAAPAEEMKGYLDAAGRSGRHGRRAFRGQTARKASPRRTSASSRRTPRTATRSLHRGWGAAKRGTGKKHDGVLDPWRPKPV